MGKSEQTSRWIDLFATVLVVKDAGLYLPDERTLPIQDWQSYIDICSSIIPNLTDEAEYIVKSYFLLNRQYRPSNQFKTKSISIIFHMSKCIARLNLRNRVTRSDAILAVLLYEEQLLALWPETMTPIVFPLQNFTHISNENETDRDMSSLLDVSERDGLRILTD